MKIFDRLLPVCETPKFMPPSIDPISNLFGSGLSIIRRLFVFCVAGGTGDFLSSLSEILCDLPGPDIFLEIGGAFLLSLILWHWHAIGYMTDAPLYALVLIATIPFFFYRIVFSDGPILFWFVLMISILAPGSFIVSLDWMQLIPIAFIFIGLGAALWHAVNLDHPEWVDRFRERED